MAALYPFSNKTAQWLSLIPVAGDTHRWLAQASGVLSGTLTPDACTRYLRRCCNAFVHHRAIPDREIQAAVALAYGGQRPQAAGRSQVVKAKANYGTRALDWPDASEEMIGKTLADYDPLFDGVTSTGLGPAEVLPGLFEPGELVCTGPSSEKAVVRPLEAALADAELMQFIVVNPMKGPYALNMQGHISPRCQNNVKERRHLVAEFDDATLTKEAQAILASALGDLAPLVMAVDSGGKSVHAWYRVDGMSAREQASFFAHACLLGADRTRWDTCGWLRMPGGLRVKSDGQQVRQKVLFWRSR